MPDEVSAEASAAVEDLSVGSLLRQAYRDDASSTRAQAPTEQPDEGDPEPLAPPEPEEPDDGTTPDDSDEEEPEQPPTQPAERGEAEAPAEPTGEGPNEALASWGAVIADSPGRIAEVPAPHRKAVLENAFERVRAQSVSQYVAAAQKVLQDTGDALSNSLKAAYNQGLSDGKNGVLLEADFAEMEAMQETDPAAWAALTKAEPAKVARFLARNDQAAAEPEQQRVQEEFKRRIARYPEAYDYLVAKEQREPQRYDKRTPQGAVNLLADVDEAIEWAISQRLSTSSGKPANGAGGGEAPAQDAQPRGERVPAKVRSLPKPMIGGGPPARGDEPLPDDVGELLRMDFRETQKRRAAQG